MFVVRCHALLLQILRFAQNDREREFRMTFLVTIDGAAGEVKDLEYLIGSLRWQPPVILREICAADP